VSCLLPPSVGFRFGDDAKRGRRTRQGLSGGRRCPRGRPADLRLLRVRALSSGIPLRDAVLVCACDCREQGGSCLQGGSAPAARTARRGAAATLRNEERGTYQAGPRSPQVGVRVEMGATSAWRTRPGPRAGRARRDRRPSTGRGSPRRPVAHRRRHPPRPGLDRGRGGRGREWGSSGSIP
jgi:hypothetical protein